VHVLRARDQSRTFLECPVGRERHEERFEVVGNRRRERAGGKRHFGFSSADARVREATLYQGAARGGMPCPAAPRLPRARQVDVGLQSVGQLGYETRRLLVTADDGPSVRA